MSTNTKSTHINGNCSQPLSQRKQSFLPVVLPGPSCLLKAKAGAGTSNRAHVAAQPSSERCLLRVCKAEGVSYSATSSGSNQVQRQTTTILSTTPCFVALERMVLLFALLSICCQNLTTEVKIKIY